MKKQLLLIGSAVLIALSGCGIQNAAKPETLAANSGHSGHSAMNHSSSGEVPQGLKAAANPLFQVGSQAVIHADHMEGMNGATATVAGAYDTVVYTVSYTPAIGGERVQRHKWVIHEEIEHASETPYQSGAEVILQADHMTGMNGAKASIDSAERTVVYMVDYKPTDGGEPVNNHKWVTEGELTAK